MIGKHKDFEPDAYETWDSPAKRAVRLHLKGRGHTVVIPEEDYGPDLYSRSPDGTRMYHEVEVNARWYAGYFPYTTGSIPERKLRLLNRLDDSQLFFWRLRTDLMRALVYNSIHLNDKYLVEVANRKISDGEYFYRIPIQLGKEFDLICR